MNWGALIGLVFFVVVVGIASWLMARDNGDWL